MAEKVPEDGSPPVAQDLLARLQSKTRSVLGAVESLLQSGAIQDQPDLRSIREAFVFIEHPTENIEDIVGHTTKIGQVLGGYEMQGEDLPPAIDNMHRYLLTLQCINRISFVEKVLDAYALGETDIARVVDEDLRAGSSFSHLSKAIVFALDWATILSRGYKDDTLLTAVTDLQTRIASLQLTE